MKHLLSQLRHRLLTWIALFVLMALVGYQVVAAQSDGVSAANELVAGSYSGSVVVREPAPLGALNLHLDITSVNGVLSGKVNAIKTQVFLGGPAFTGKVTVSQGITPTVRIESQVFSGVVSGRTVRRSFVLTGDVMPGSDQLRGHYIETIVGFKAKPMQVKGTFLLVRPAGVTAIVTVRPPNGSTATATNTPTVTTTPPTATPTATPTIPSGNNTGSKVYLPLVAR